MATSIVDLRDAARSLRRDRGFSLTVILTLAVTIGATTAAFSIVNGILIRPLAYPEPERLVTLREVWREVQHNAATLPVNQRHFEHWRRNSRAFQSMAQFITLPANLTSGGPAAQISVVQASGTLFDVLGQRAAAGRLLAADDDRAGGPDVAVIGDGLWQQRFGGRPDVLGAAIVLDGRPFTVIGVLPPSFRLPEGERLAANVDAVIPMRIEVGWVGDHNNSAIARMAPGVTLEQAQAELDVLQRQAGELASAESGQHVTLAGVVTRLDESIVGRSRQSVLLLFGALVAVLAIACSNLTNLALIRALARARDVAIRSALGASRRRLVARAVLDFALLAAAGGALGLWIAYAALRVFVQTAPVDLPRIEDVAIDARVIVFAIAITGITGLLVAILPVLHLVHRDPQAALRSGSSAAGQGPAGLRARTVLTAVQVALAVTLLTITALLGTSLMRVLDIDYGFSTDHVVSVSIAMPAARYSDDRSRVDAFDRILGGVSALPGVVSASSTSLLPMRGEGQVNFVVADGTSVPRSEQPSANFRFVSPDYFAALQLPVQSGRMFLLAERGRGPLTPSVVSASLAARLWPEQDALGKVFSRGIEGEPGFEVVGVAADARTTSLERTPPLMVYVPYWWRTRTSLSLLVKTSVEPLTLAPAIRRVVEQIDPEIAVGQARLLQEAVNAATAARRYQSRLFVVFGVVALLITTLGVYAVTAYSLSKRRREMNIRVALGAHTTDVVRLLMQQTSAAVLPGVVAGVGGALALGGAIASLLYEVRPRDPLVLGVVAIGVGVVAVLASLLATRNGLSIDPAAALREE
ncbi:MAG TPA: ABC transporter permease [Vicinamibacterales bacterium]|nr:ABC transporter permease [Vicinamibacterales bacterium]